MGAASNGATKKLDKRLQSEVLNLIQYIQRLRQEIAGIAQQRDDETPFDSMAERLDAILGSTAEATESILTALEDIDGFVEELRGQPTAEEIDAICDRIAERTTGAMEACSFQDLTGQRVNKVIASLKFVEERVNAMADICGRGEIVPVDGEVPAPPQQLDDGIALDGPQRAGVAISQDEIDNLFS